MKFQSREERFRQLESFIDQMLEDNQNLTTRELNKLLRRQFGCKLMNGAVLFNGTSYDLPEHVLTTLRSNDRLSAHTQPAMSVQKPNIIQGVRKALQQRGGFKDGNREHEVGGHGNYDDIDDERKLKR